MRAQGDFQGGGEDEQRTEQRKGCEVAWAIVGGQGSHVLLSCSLCLPILSAGFALQPQLSIASVPTAGTPGALAAQLCAGASEGLVQRCNLPEHACP